MALSIQERNFNLRTICSALQRVEYKWFKIGVQLGIPRHMLKQFKGDEEDPLSAVVECCLQGNATEVDEPISWQSIVEALKSVGEPGLAKEISKKYFQLEETETTESGSSELKQEPTESNSNETVMDKSEQIMEKTIFQEDCTVKQAIGAGEEPENSEQISQQENNSASKEAPRKPLDPKVKMDLEFILNRNLKEIIEKYGIYVDTLREMIERGVTPEALRAFLMTLTATSANYKGHHTLALLSDKEIELKECTTVTAIFELLITKCASFLNYGVFQSILKRYKVTEGQEVLNYQEHINVYINKHKISEFVKMNPLLKKKNGSIELIVKFDIETTCRLAKVTELTTLIAEIMDLNPSALQIVDIEDGCHRDLPNTTLCC